MGDHGIQRRLAAILAADVAGYTRLMEEDTDGTVAAWTAAREGVIDPTVSAHSGRIVKLTGDGFLVEFPTVQQAVACAIDMQEKMADSPLKFRMGVNLGDIIDDGRDIHGEGVNIAARLEALADEGGICVSGLVYESIRNRIEASFEDLGEKAVKHVSAPVRVYRIGVGDGVEEKVSPLAESMTSVLERPAVAVLPFDNMSGDADQDYFADGLTEDIITELSKYGWFPVIAHNSTFVFRGKSIDIKEVGEKLGARYVVEGSVRKAGSRIRIAAQLIDAATGHHIWAERYDRELEDVFAVQDEITMQLAGTIMPELSAAQQKLALRKPPENLEAWEIFLHGQWWRSRFTREDFTEARLLLLDAVRLDPEMSMAHALIADIGLWSLSMNWAADPSATSEEAQKHVTRALTLDAGNAHAHACMAWLKFYTGHHAEAREEGETAIRLNPSYAEGHLYLGNLYLYLGEPKAAIEEQEIMRNLSPRDPLTFVVDSFQNLANYLLGDYEKAVILARQSIRKKPDFLVPHLHLAAACGQLGRLDQAREALAARSQLQSDLSEALIKGAWPLANPNHFEALLDGVRKAGLPEG